IEPIALVRARARVRIRHVGQALSVALGLVGLRGSLLCVWPHADTLRLMARERWEPEEVHARRGEILDRAGNRLATTVPSPNVVASPERIEDDEVPVLAARVAAILHTDPAPIASRMRKDNKYQVLAKEVDAVTADQIEALGHPGVWIEQTPHRYYPEQTLGASVLGFVDANGAGQEGLERSLDTWLRGESLFVQQLYGKAHKPPTEIARGMDVTLTLDRTIQGIAERALDRVMETSAPSWASAVVVDVRTGEVLAMANAPSFNPNAIDPHPERRRNHAV